MRTTGVDHLDLVVSSLERSLPLYRQLLAPLGYTRASEIVGERGERVVYLGGPGVVPVSLRQAQVAGSYDRYRVGIHHIAFEAPSRELVDERLAWAREQGLEIETAPKEYDYRPGYDAGFFHDPDGIKLEVVHVPDAAPGGSG
jgi:catechol 2,3-dioxygenase-like lactoylglutathione lyase family enzyme